MRTKITSLLIVLFLVGFVGTTTAANNQGLSWEVEVGDRFNYKIFGVNNGIQDIDWDMYIQFYSVGELNETVMSFGEMVGQYPSFSTYWSNGTLNEYYSWPVLMVFPTGNWSLVEDVYLEYFSQFFTVEDFVETDSTWGYIISGGSSDVTATITAIYSKTDGVLNYYQSIRDDDTSRRLREITREGYSSPGGLDPNLLLYIGIGGVLVIVVVAAYVRRR